MARDTICLILIGEKLAEEKHRELIEVPKEEAAAYLRRPSFITMVWDALGRFSVSALAAPGAGTQVSYETRYTARVAASAT